MRVALIGAELEENLALRYIHASLVRAGHAAAIFDFHAPTQAADVAAGVRAFAPELVGLSMVFTSRARQFLDLAARLREAGLTAHITAGGHFASFHAELLLREYAQLDSVLHGEGEEAMVDLAENLARPESVAGITCRVGGRIVSTGGRPVPDDLDARPWPSRPERFHEYLGLPIANMLSGRGCYGHCSFCSIRAWYRRCGGKCFRPRRVKCVAEEMADLYHGRGVRIFNFHDDNFFMPTPAGSIRRFQEWKRHLDALGVGRIGIQCKARPDSISPDVLEALTALGVFRVFLGVESNSVAGLKTLGRGITAEQNARALALLGEAKLHATFNLLIFDPECSVADIRDNIDFIRRHAEFPLNFCRTEIYTGTPLEQRLRRQGRLTGDGFGYDYAIADPAAQLAYELYRQVFTPRNFQTDGMNLQGMRADYYYHLLRHFHFARVTAKLTGRVKGLIRRLNGNNADLLEEICRFAEARAGRGAAEADRFARGLSARRARYDGRMAPRVEELLAEIRCLAAGAAPGERARFIRRVASVAAAGVLVTVIGCQKETHPTEMVPQPTQRPNPDRPGAAGAPARLPVAMQAVSMLPPAAPVSQPAPPRPPTTASSQTTSTTSQSQPAVKELPAELARAVQDQINNAINQHILARLARQHGVNNKTVSVYLELSERGTVAKCRVQLPAGELPAFQKALQDAVRKWQFPTVRQAGCCIVTLTFKIETEMCETG